MQTLCDIRVLTFDGQSVKPYLRAIAKLRLSLLLEFPYLYQSNLTEEIFFLENHLQHPEARAVLIFDSFNLVGFATSLPLECCAPELQKPFIEKEMEVHRYYFLADSFLMQSYRGRGLGHHLFDQRELYAKKLQRFHSTCFASIERAASHPKHTEQEESLHNFWEKRGYTRNNQLHFYQLWKDIDSPIPSPKTFIFWTKHLP